ncbi:unnamed protein product [Diatraea saccharalis]|uniref:Uncharacterized protein n=1 Tax=Diatraea saccharalis TaxID=40085 RepID=A0A9N9WAS8_9NEOP|nr:unnamed protein product [Diatraea saccharalis]
MPEALRDPTRDILNNRNGIEVVRVKIVIFFAILPNVDVGSIEKCRWTRPLTISGKNDRAGIEFASSTNVTFSYRKAESMIFALRVSNVQDCPDVTRNCSTLRSPHGVACRLRGLAPGRYELALTHLAPWVSGDFMRNKATTRNIFEVNSPRVAGVGRVGAGGAGWGWARGWGAAAAALLALCAAAALLLCALQRRRHRARSKRVLSQWLHREESKQQPVGGAGPILVAYAREGPAFRPLVQALLDLLEAAAPGQVLDLHSARTAALAAGGAAAWLRALLAAPHRLVLLQSPALRLPPPGAAGEVLYRCPEPGDWLLPLLLRTVQEHRDPTPYRKHYLATAVEAGGGPRRHRIVRNVTALRNSRNTPY